MEQNRGLAVQMKEKILKGYQVTKEDALRLYSEPLEEVCRGADEIRRHFCGDRFDICTIVNGRSGKCSENCKFCAQSAYYHTSAKEYPLLEADEIVRQARYNAERGVLRYSIVTSGRALNDREIGKMCEAIRAVKEKVKIEVCVSFGLLTKEQFCRVKEAGASRVHNNLETSRRNFPNVCTTHTFEDKLCAVRAAQQAGLEVCSGGIMGLGETVEDRVDMAFTLREMGIKSVPVNMLNPIPGTPYEQNERLSADDMRRIAAVYRFILPDAAIRLAGGRGLLDDKGEKSFLSGANAAISGDMLTTAGYTVESDMEMIGRLGYQAKL